MAPRVECEGSRPPACSEHGCRAPLPRGCTLLATEEGLDTLCRGWSGERPDCVCLEKAEGTAGVRAHLVELKAAHGLLARRGGLERLARYVAGKVGSAATRLSSCLGAELDRVVVSLPLEAAGKAVAARLAAMLGAAVRGRARTLVLVDCSGGVWLSRRV